jgi:hypothetical protein
MVSPLKFVSRGTHPDKYVSILPTCRDEIIHDFSGAAIIH